VVFPSAATPLLHFRVYYISQENNLVAVSLSRAITGAIHLGLDYARMAADQVSDPNIQAFRSVGTGL